MIQEDYNNRTVYEHLNEKTIQNYFYLYVSNNINVMWYQVNLTQKFSTDLGLDVNTKWNLVPVKLVNKNLTTTNRLAPALSV